MNAKVERALERGHTNTSWLDSYHSFSFGDYNNPNRMDFGALRVLNEDRIAHGKGFGDHPHSDMEIITIPIRGMVHHKDSEGNEAQFGWGKFQVMSAGTGITHSEYNDVDKNVLELLQIWIRPNEHGTKPWYEVFDFSERIHPNELTTLVAPDGTAPGRIKQDAWISIGEFERGTRVTYNLHSVLMGVYLLVVEGKVVIGDLELEPGDGIGVDITDTVEFIAQPRSKVLVIEVPMGDPDEMRELVDNENER